MFGNLTGWMISAAIVVLTTLSLFALDAQMRAQTGETAFIRDARNLEPIALPVTPASVVAMGGSEDAGSLYRQAIAEYKANKDLYEDFRGKGTLNHPSLSRLTAVDLIVKATGAGKATIFLNNPAEVVNYDLDKEPLAALENVGKVAVRLALVYKQKDADKALQYAQAAFSLGAKLVDERLCFSEYLAGTGLMGDASYLMAAIYKAKGEGGKADAIKAFDDARQQYHKEHVTPVRTIIAQISDQAIANNAGNVFGLARKSKERMWRAESMLRIGLYKFNANNYGDQQAAKDLSAKWANDPTLDPVLRTAAGAADRLSLQDYKGLR